MKKYFKNIFFISISVIAIILFFNAYVTWTFDSAEYYYLSLIIKGTISINNWNIIRGPSFPFLINLFSSIFDGGIGLKIFLVIFYIGLIYLSYFIINKFMNKSKKEMVVIYSLYVIFIVFNPIIMSYSHLLLIESIMPFILLLSIIIADKFTELSFRENKIKFILFSLYFIIMTPFVWFLKQPFIIAFLSTLLLTCVLKFIKKRDFKRSVIYLIIILISVASLIISITLWNQYLNKNEVVVGEKNSEKNLIENTILLSISSNYKTVKNADYVYVMSNDFIEEEDKNKILSLIEAKETNKFRIFEVYDTNDKLIDIEIRYIDKFDIKEAIKFYISNTIKRPLLTLDSYHRSYMSTIDIYDRDINTYEVKKGFNLKKYIDEGKLFDNEIRDYGLQIFESGRSNFSWESANIYIPKEYEYINYIEKFREVNQMSLKLSDSLTRYAALYIIVFIISYLILPIILIYSIIKYIKSKYESKYFYISILLSVAYINLITHVLMGTIIDRYIYPGFPLILLGCILFFIKTDKKL